MLGFILGALAAGCVCSAVSSRNSYASYYEARCRSLEFENSCLLTTNTYLRVTFDNHLRLLADYDKVNKYAKSIGYRGAVDFFYYLADYHDSRFSHFARFLNKVRHVRNDVAHRGISYNIDRVFLNKLSACVEVCREYDRLPSGRRLYLN
jgi:hypothetical protein